MKWTVLLATCCIYGLCPGAINVSVCDPTTLEPYALTDVMTGMDVAIVIDSNSPALWSGGLYLEGDNRGLGSLLGRVRDPNSRDWIGSHLPAAGLGALVLEWEDSLRWGFDLYTDDLQRQAGKWFVLNYRALRPGPCTVLFYDYGQSWTIADPNNSITFLNSPTRDLVADGIVNYADFSVFSKAWAVHTGTSDPNLLSHADFNMDGDVDMIDLCLFSDFWMFGVPGWKPSEDISIMPNDACPYLSYRIHTAEGAGELNLQVGESVVLYISKESCGADVFVIDLEAQISDPNLGWIDNRMIDPNHPEASTARIVFTPRDTGFDYWGPGLTQREGIEFVGANLFYPVTDGPIASFVYTAEAAGTVELNLTDYIAHSNHERIVIHQYEEVQQMQSSPDPAIETAGALPESDSAAGTGSEQPVISEVVADTLETLRETEPQLQQLMNETEWDAFIEVVRNSETAN